MKTDPRPGLSLILAIALLAGTGPAVHAQVEEEDPPAVELADLPELNVDALEPAVADQLTEMYGYVVGQITEQERTPAQLSDAIGELGRLYLAYELYGPGETCLRLSARLAPRNFAWPYHLGYLTQQEGRLDEAARYYERALSILPTVTPALIRLGQVYSGLNRPEAAEWVLRQALINDSTSSAAQAVLGEVLVEQKRFAEAVELLTAVLESNPGADRFYYPLALAYRGLGREAEARAALEKRGPVGIRPADPLIDGLSEKALGERVMLLRGRAAYSAGHFDVAAEEFRRALESQPESIPALINLGTTLGRLGDVEGAAEQFRKAIELAPANSTAQLNLGSLLASQGRLEEALPHFEEAARYSPDDAGMRWELAETQRRLGKLEDALLHYRAAIRLAPPAEMARFREAQVLDALDRDADARDSLEAGLQVLPRSLSLANALARLLAASPDPAIRDGARAQELADRVISEAATVSTVETAAMAYAENGDCDKAVELQNQVVEAAADRDDPALVAQAQQALEHYQSSRPCRVPLGRTP